MDNLEVKRHELKYYINNVDHHSLVHRLKHALKTDPYGKPHTGYFIRSLYFDSYDDECLFEKQSGNLYRKKYRLRIYDLNADKVKFEIKNKMNNQIFKETAPITRASAEKIIAGDYDELLKYDNPILNKIYTRFVKKQYRPKVIVEYTRDAFLFDFFKIRITFDKNLRSNTTDFDLFSSYLQTIPVILEDKLILEIKYNEYLPDFINNLLPLGTCVRQAISKYTLSRKYLKIRSWEDN